MARFSLHEPGRQGRVKMDQPPGIVTLVNKPDALEFYIDATPGYASAQMAEALREARKLGLDEFDPAEDEPEILDDGTIRVWLTPADALAVTNNPLSTMVAVP